MSIDIKQLDKLMSLCRKRGIKTFKMDNIEFTLEETPVKTHQNKHFIPIRDSFDPGPMPTPNITKIEMPDLPSEDELLYYSAGGN